MKLGLEGSRIAYNREKLEKASQKQLVELYGWLYAFKTVFIRYYEEAYAKIPESTWKFYEVTETKGTWEQNNLEAAKKEMLAEWKKRPFLIRREKHDKHGKKKNRGTREKIQNFG